MIGTRQKAAIGLMVVLALAAAGCENSVPDPAERAAIEKAVEGYLGALAEAYSNFDVSPLEKWASPNEVVRVRNLLKGLAQTGDRVDSTQRTHHIEHLEVFREINATVRMVEVWDVIRYDAFTGVEKGRTENSIQNTLLQLRLVDGRWIVIGRTVMDREAPEPEGVGETG